jgi:hypothetical protein
MMKMFLSAVTTSMVVMSTLYALLPYLLYFYFYFYFYLIYVSVRT